MTVPFTTQSLQDALTAKLALNFGTEPGEATDQEMLKACALVLRDVMALRGVQTAKETKKEQKKQVHYLSLEYLMGRSLMKNAYNLGVLPELKEALGNLGFKSGDLFELEPDAGRGNGGLGRLAACYLDSMSTLDIPATGYSICYELGIFKQKIVEGQQVELPDDWKGVGSAWLLPKPDEAQAVHFGGTLREFWHGGHLHIVNENSTTVLAVPCDMVVAGYDTDHVNTLRLWDARSTRPVDMALFSRGEYLKASEDDSENRESWAYPFPRASLPDHFSFCIDQLTYEERDSLWDSARNADMEYVPGETYTVTLDGFIISDNIECVSYDNINTGYTYSDHDPVSQRSEFSYGSDRYRRRRNYCQQADQQDRFCILHRDQRCRQFQAQGNDSRHYDHFQKYDTIDSPFSKDQLPVHTC